MVARDKLALVARPHRETFENAGSEILRMVARDKLGLIARPHRETF